MYLHPSPTHSAQEFRKELVFLEFLESMLGNPKEKGLATRPQLTIQRQIKLFSFLLLF